MPTFVSVWLPVYWVLSTVLLPSLPTVIWPRAAPGRASMATAARRAAKRQGRLANRSGSFMTVLKAGRVLGRRVVTARTPKNVQMSCRYAKNVTHPRCGGRFHRRTSGNDVFPGGEMLERFAPGGLRGVERFAPAPARFAPAARAAQTRLRAPRQRAKPWPQSAHAARRQALSRPIPTDLDPRPRLRAGGHGKVCETDPATGVAAHVGVVDGVRIGAACIHGVARVTSNREPLQRVGE